MTGIVSPIKVKQLALEIAAQHRSAANFTRVSKDFINAVEADARAFILDRVKRHPSRGRTLK